jgi:hypothetical protein
VHAALVQTADVGGTCESVVADNRLTETLSVVANSAFFEAGGCAGGSIRDCLLDASADIRVETACPAQIFGSTGRYHRRPAGEMHDVPRTVGGAEFEKAVLDSCGVGEETHRNRAALRWSQPDRCISDRERGTRPELHLEGAVTIVSEHQKTFRSMAHPRRLDHHLGRVDGESAGEDAKRVVAATC